MAEQTAKAEPAKKSYRVVSRIQMGLKTYEPGATIELTEAQAAVMPWAVAPLRQAKTEEPSPAEAETAKSK